jgi:predicted acetyltransferase
MRIGTCIPHSEIELVEAKKEDKPVIRQLLELYAHDFSEFDQEDVNEHGFYGYDYLDCYWTEATRHPFLIRVGGKLAGLVLVSDYCYTLDDKSAKSVSEFFVMRKFRRRGKGKTVAGKVFDQFPGKWEVIQHEANLLAKGFWEAVIGEYTQGRYEVQEVETEDWKGQALLFDSSNHPGASPNSKQSSHEPSNNDR